MPTPSIVEDFDESPITPSGIKAVLKKCSSSSTPDVDGISYAILKRLPSCHHYLATLFSKILLESNEAPPVWCSGKIILIYKRVINLIQEISSKWHFIVVVGYVNHYIVLQ